ncbi:hypothetical protein M3221_17590 [Domibacillus indicus]|nr:hypothetical protein [Domibacillus indicus]MCM3790196.1 hypothetical protein [Domibacillus indicus]
MVEEGLIFIKEIRLLYGEYLKCGDHDIKQMIHDDILSLVEAMEVMDSQR